MEPTTKNLTPTNTFTDTPTVTNTPTNTVTVTSTLTVTSTITPTVTPTALVPQGETWLFYYYSGTTRIAMRQISQYGDTVMFLLTDHLGSSSIVTDAQGAKIGEVRYKAWGETRYDSGNVPTKQRYTGQREETELGLIYYGARWYDPSIGRFNQADSFIPQPWNPVAWDRYAYTQNNPIRYIDPSGNTSACAYSNADPECNPADDSPKRNTKPLNIKFNAKQQKPRWNSDLYRSVSSVVLEKLGLYTLMARIAWGEEGLKAGQIEFQIDVKALIWALRNRLASAKSLGWSLFEALTRDVDSAFTSTSKVLDPLYGYDEFSDNWIAALDNLAWVYQQVVEIMNAPWSEDPLHAYGQWISWGDVGAPPGEGCHTPLVNGSCANNKDYEYDHTHFNIFHVNAADKALDYITRFNFCAAGVSKSDCNAGERVKNDGK